MQVLWLRGISSDSSMWLALNTSRRIVHREIEIGFDRWALYWISWQYNTIDEVLALNQFLGLNPVKSPSRNNNSNIRWRSQKLCFLAINLIRLNMSTLLMGLQCCLILESIEIWSAYQFGLWKSRKRRKRRDIGIWECASPSRTYIVTRVYNVDNGKWVKTGHLHHSHNNLFWSVTHQRLGFRNFIHKAAGLSILNYFSELSPFRKSLLQHRVKKGIANNSEQQKEELGFDGKDN